MTLAALVLPWIWVAVTASLALGALVLRSRASAGMALAAAATGALLWAPAWTPAAPRAVDEGFRVVTWNVARLGEYASWKDRKRAERETLACVTEALAEEAPDAVVLQEISRNRLSVLAAAAGLTCEHTDYYGTDRPTAGGLAVCVRQGGPYALRTSRTLAMPPDWHYVFAELVDEAEEPGTGDDEHPRPGRRVLNVLGVHFRPFDVDLDDLREGMADLARGEGGRLSGLTRSIERSAHGQTAQTDRLLVALDSLRDPTLLTGDFNSTPDMAIHVALRRNLADLWLEVANGLGATRTAEGWLPLRIDYVYATRAHFVPSEAHVVDDSCSDHRAVSARVGFRE